MRFLNQTKDARIFTRMNLTRQEQLRRIPGVDQILDRMQENTPAGSAPRTVQLTCVRAALAQIRTDILEKSLSDDDLNRRIETLPADISERIHSAMRPKLLRTINATGVVVHTNLGRSSLCDSAIDHLLRIAGHYSNLEYNLAMGKRGSRYAAVEEILCEVSGAEAGLVVNNNAAAVLICLETLARDREVVVSRGELVEIGGSFRIPDVMTKSGALLREIGTTNRTHLKDYENAIGEKTALLLKVHKSNFSIVGFTKEVGLGELVALGRSRGLLVMEDLGSGTFIDLSKYGLTKEPTVQESVAAGVDVVTFSGDKLLGGPQAGIIVGKREIIDRIKKNPINRALRIDKMTLAALESTLTLYRDPETAVTLIPTLRMITQPLSQIEFKAELLSNVLSTIDPARISTTIRDGISKTGGGSLPLQSLPTRCVAITVQGISINRVERFLRENDPPIIGRIESDALLLDPRTIEEGEFEIIHEGFKRLIERHCVNPNG
jgi:L-seryl-tRNA(Ser) seleniumtransferase